MTGAQQEGELGKRAATGALEFMWAGEEAFGRADRLWGTVTTAMPPSHDYVTAARELHVVLTNVTHDGPHARDVNEISKNLDIGHALADLRYAATDVADVARDIHHVSYHRLRTGFGFSQAVKLETSQRRLQHRN